MSVPKQMAEPLDAREPPSQVFLKWSVARGGHVIRNVRRHRSDEVDS